MSAVEWMLIVVFVIPLIVLSMVFVIGACSMQGELDRKKAILRHEM